MEWNHEIPTLDESKYLDMIKDTKCEHNDLIGESEELVNLTYKFYEL